MRVIASSMALVTALMASGANAAGYWDFQVTVTASGTKSTYVPTGGPTLTPFSQTFTFTRSLSPFASTTDLADAYNSPYVDPFGLGFRFGLNGIVTLQNGLITGSDLRYSSANYNCISGTLNGCMSYDLSAPTFSLAFIRTQGDVAAPVPEPATWSMMLLGFAGIGFALRRKGSAVSPIAFSRA